MKKIFLFAALTIALVVSSLYGCRKDEKKELYSNYYLEGTSCENGFQDGTETGIDCGGICDPCPPIVVPCNQANNTIRWDNISYPTAITDMTNGGTYIYLDSGATLYISFGGADPTTGVYAYNEAGVSAGYVYIKYTDQWGLYDHKSYYDTGNVQVTVNDTSWNIKGCNLKLSKNGGVSYTPFNLNVNCY